ncbi:nucleotidyltransferase domain-containing protein [Opitutus sp. ER46]|uniref:nucleotidyltransferase family protein n=1 Tax=Opitutus sp. ER46 TaxID=2161864 RepID=UPI000D3183A2|nr:nucleotidyltransferase domain-containing protein [Opitutus sp. ER46]PTY01259.1 hypothetical protein DB354_00160 [Opitutus sp. ER46]
MNHATFSRKGGRARSLAKTIANRAKAVAYWEARRSGRATAARRRSPPPAPAVIGQLLADYCRRVGITRLELFGSTARGQAKAGSDVDLIATFRDNPGLRFFTMEDEMAAILGVPVHLLTRDAVDEMTNPYRRASILADAKEL